MDELPRTPPEFVEWLVARHPALAPLLNEHLAFNEELLPHVLFGDVTRYAADLARRARRNCEAEAQLLTLLTDLDAALLPEGKSDLVDNLVWVSFVENARGRPLIGRLRSFPNLARALSHYE